MSLRFSSVEAMEAAFGKKLRVRDSFDAPAARPPGPARSSAPGKEIGEEPKKLRQRRRSSGPTPHDMLWGAVGAALVGAEREFENAVPGRKYRLDIALPAARLAIEVDGWEWHGKHKGDFTRDRERQNLLTLHGWRILRFTAGQIRRDTGGCVKMIEEAVAGCDPETYHRQTRA